MSAVASEPPVEEVDSVPLSLGPRATPAGPHEVCEGRILLRVPGLARALVDASGARVEAEPGASEEAVEWFSRRHLPTARRLAAGKFTLWAAGVVVDGQGVALIGTEASGKSTVAASLADRGCPVLADQALEIEFEGATAVAGASAHELELWPESVTTLGFAPEAGEIVRPGLDKRAYDFPMASPVPLSLIVALERSPEPGLERESLAGGAAIEQLVKATCMPGIIEAAGLRAAHFMWLMQLCGAVKVVRIRTSRFELDIPAVSEAILAEVRS